MKLPAFTTFTGVDVHTDIDRLQDLSRRFDVEWGVLISEKWSGAEGALRYPQIDWIQNLYNKGLNLALHVCNGLAYDFVKLAPGQTVVGSVVDLQQFQRVQVNHHITLEQLASAVRNFHGSVIAQLFDEKTILKIDPFWLCTMTRIAFTFCGMSRVVQVCFLVIGPSRKVDSFTTPSTVGPAVLGLITCLSIFR